MYERLTNDELFDRHQSLEEALGPNGTDRNNVDAVKDALKKVEEEIRRRGFTQEK